MWWPQSHDITLGCVSYIILCTRAYSIYCKDSEPFMLLVYLMCVPFPSIHHPCTYLLYIVCHCTTHLFLYWACAWDDWVWSRWKNGAQAITILCQRLQQYYCSESQWIVWEACFLACFTLASLLECPHTPIMLSIYYYRSRLNLRLKQYSMLKFTTWYMKTVHTWHRHSSHFLSVIVATT